MNGFEQQTITIIGTGGLLSGSFILSFNSVSTPAIAINASSYSIKAALQSITNIGDVIVRRRDSVGADHVLQLYIVFTERLGDLDMINVDYTKVRNSNSTGTVTVLYDESSKGKIPIMESKYRRSAILNVSSDSAVMNYLIQDLYEGMTYHVRVSAWNGVGAEYGAVRGSTPALISPLKKPSSVRDLTISPIDSQTLNISWNIPSDIGGPSLKEYYLYENSSPLQISVSKSNSVQELTVSSLSTNLFGSFYVKNSGEMSAAIDVNSSASDVKFILENMFTIDKVNVSIVDNSVNVNRQMQSYGRTWRITFFQPQAKPLLVSTGGVAGLIATSGTITGYSAVVSVRVVSPEQLPSFVVRKGVVCGQNYVASVTPSNGAFVGPLASVSLPVSCKATLPSIPVDAFMSAVSDKEIQVTWSAPLYVGGSNITGFCRMG